MKKTAWIRLVILSLMLGCAAVAEEEVYPTVDFELDAYGFCGAMLTVTYTDGTEDETGGWCYSMELNDETPEKVGEIIRQSDVESIGAVYDGDVFEGWMVYEFSFGACFRRV